MEKEIKTVSPMSNEGRNMYVIDHITEALLELLRDKPIKEISISELCDSAGVGRASFYRNFDSKEDILRTYTGRLFDDLRKEYENNGQPALSDLIGMLFGHFEQHKEFYSLLNKRQLIYLLKDVIIGICGPKPEHSKTEAYATAFVAYTLYGWIELWFQRGMQEPAEELRQMFQAQNL